MTDEFTPAPDVDPADVDTAAEPASDDQPPVVAFLVALARSVATPGEDASAAVLAAAHDVVSEIDQ